MWCPNCKAEYRDGFTVCADCKVDLTGERPPAPEHSREDWVEVWRGESARASLVCAALESAGIEAIDYDAPLSTLGWDLPVMHEAFRVLVRKTDQQEARRILQGMDRIDGDVV